MLIVLCILEIFRIVTPVFAIQDGPSIRSLPLVGTWTRVIGIAQLAFEPLVYAIHFLRPSSKNKVSDLFRHVGRFLICGFCSYLLIQMRSIYQLSSESYLVWRVPLWRAVVPFSAVSHVMTVSCFGYFEATVKSHSSSRDV